MCAASITPPGAAVAATTMAVPLDLFEAAKNNHPEKLEAILAGGADPNTTNEKGVTPLFLAAGSGHTEIIKILLNRGADPDRARQWDGTPLHQAAENGHVQAIQMLLKRGADPNTCDFLIGTALHMAARLGNTKALQALLDGGADPNVGDEVGLTPLHSAALAHRTQVLKMLLDRGADPNGADEEGYTPLHSALQHCDRTEALQVLLAYGANLDKADRRGKTPLDVAIGWHRAGAVRTFLASGAKATEAQINAHFAEDDPIRGILLSAKAENLTPIVYALLNSTSEEIRKVLSFGAYFPSEEEVIEQATQNPDLSDEDKKSAINRAKSQYAESIKGLRELGVYHPADHAAAELVATFQAILFDLRA